MVEGKNKKVRLFLREVTWLKERGFTAREMVRLRRIVTQRDGGNGNLIEQGLSVRRLEAYKGAVERGIYKED